MILFVRHEIEEMFQTRDKVMVVFNFNVMKLLLDDVVVFSLTEIER